MENVSSLGTRLRSLRNERGLSQRELAEKAGLSANAISLIERDETSPSVATLQNLASALEIKIGYFFEEENSKIILVAKNGDRPAISARGVRIESIGGKLNYQEMEAFVITLDPHSESGYRQVVHTGHELVYCLDGQVEYIVDGEVYTLEAGDILMFEAHLPHIWRNTHDKKSNFLLVLQTPGNPGEPVERHFSRYPSLPHLS